ncbi:MAG: hypothetical protein HY908_03160 [Myxococcales bacterium]|nr:hypothetical protein [Myxococcales bacterium]
MASNRTVGRVARVSWLRLGLGLGLGAAVAAVASAACSKTDDTPPPGGPTCAPSDPTCPAISPDCLALTDNAGAPAFTLRLSQLTITKPTALAQQFIAGLIGGGVNINLPQCNVSGKGTFSWLLHFDTTTNMLLTGGALPKTDPSSGYCFVDDTVANIHPVQIATTIAPDGTFTAGPLADLTVPVYLDITATSTVLLPLHQLMITEAKVSADHNCIGGFNWQGLQPLNNCKPNLDLGIDYYLNDATMAAYITLEEADTVVVAELGKTLCVLLGANDTLYADQSSPKKCLRDANSEIVLQGDWCSTTNSAGGCADSMQLAAEFAASAAELEAGCTLPP